jgi:hypothetical protein
VDQYVPVGRSDQLDLTQHLTKGAASTNDSIEARLTTWLFFEEELEVVFRRGVCPIGASSSGERLRSSPKV